MRALPLLVLLFFVVNLSAQDDYFQQYLAYDIDVTLDDRRHELHGDLRLTYHNYSPDTLREIYYHVWPNAYARKNTAFAKQKLRNGSTRFHFSDPADGGRLDSLAWRTADGGDVVDYGTDQIDVRYLGLPTPLLPGEKIELVTPFRVKIPKSFSRLGRVGESYQLTQWFPKPAVYDHNGWHAMPYLDLGEYYGEFATFDVKITLPENYTIGATGELQTRGEHAADGQQEHERLRQKATADRADLERRAAQGTLSSGFVFEPFPASATATKTLHYRAERVHDFAWFADKRFRVLHDTLQLAGRPAPIDVWALFNETEAAYWKDATDYLKNATRFYSEQLGTYPYPQVTGLQSALSVGGGMEYPMVTVIGFNNSARDLDEVLAHEVGHNWFYGILGSNERDHAWMDEGFNTFYEQRYMDKYYPDRDSEMFGFEVDMDRLGYRYTARQGQDQPPATRADSLREFNYWIEAYSKPALVLKQLEASLGTRLFDNTMRKYYERWAFKHPQPEDFFAVFDEISPLVDMTWLRDAMLTTKTSNWKVVDKQAGRAILEHRGELAAPAVDKQGSETIAENAARKSVAIGPDERIALSEEHNPLDLYGSDNVVGKKTKVRLAIQQEQTGERQLFALPLVAFNEHDGPLLGGVLHNRTLEPRRWEWALAPLFGFESSSLNGFAGLRRRIARPFAGVRQAVVDLGYQRFGDFTLPLNDEPFHYQRIGLRGALDFYHAPITEMSSGLDLQLIQLLRNRPTFSEEGMLDGAANTGDFFARLTYRRGNASVLRPTAWRTTLEARVPDETNAFRAGHLRLEAEFTGGYQYEADHFVRYRLFGGYFLANELRDRATRSPTAFALVDNAATDYRYDDLYLGRNLGGIYGQQLEQRQGGFRAPVSAAQSFGASNNYLVALNVDAQVPALPAAFPLGIYLDAGYYGFRAFTSEPETGTFSWVGGLSLTALDGRVGLYAPLVADPDTKMLLDSQGNLLNRLSVRLNLAGLMPWKWIDDLL